MLCALRPGGYRRVDHLNNLSGSYYTQDLLDQYRAEIEAFARDDNSMLKGFADFLEGVDSKTEEASMRYFLGGQGLDPNGTRFEKRRERFLELLRAASISGATKKTYKDIANVINESGVKAPKGVADMMKKELVQFIAKKIPSGPETEATLASLTSGLGNAMRGSIFQRWMDFNFLKSDLSEYAVSGLALGKAGSGGRRVDFVKLQKPKVFGPKKAVIQEVKYYSSGGDFGKEQVSQLRDYKLMMDRRIKIDGADISHCEYYFSNRGAAMANWRVIKETLGERGKIYYIEFGKLKEFKVNTPMKKKPNIEEIKKAA